MLNVDEALLRDQLGIDDLAPLLERGEVLDIGGGQTVVRDQEALDALYLLLEGRLAMAVEVAGHSIQLGEVDPGNWVGEVALFSESPTAVSTVTTVSPCRLFRLSFTDFRALHAEAPEIACRLAHVLNGMLIQRLRATINDPILDPAGQLLMLGHLSVPMPAHHEHHGVRDFFRRLLGVDDAPTAHAREDQE